MEILKLAILYLLATSLTVVVHTKGYNIEVRNIWVLLIGGTIIPLVVSALIGWVLGDEDDKDDKD